MKDSVWRRRFLAPRISLPRWARDEPGRCVFSSNETGKWEIYTWDTRTDERCQTTDRPEGTRTGVLDPAGEFIWWWADEKGGEAGCWMIQPFYGDEAKVAIPDIPSAFSSGIDLGREAVVLGTSDRDGHRIYLNRSDQTSVLYESSNYAGVGSLSRDEKLLAMMHSEHGDARSPALRVIDLEGGTVAELWDGQGNELRLGPWSPVWADHRMLISRTISGRSQPAIWDVEEDRIIDLSLELSGELSPADWFPDGDAIVVRRTYRGRAEAHRFHIESGEFDQIDIEQGTVAGIRVRPDGEIWYQLIRSSRAEEIRSLASNGEGSRVLLRAEGDPPPEGVRYSDFDVGPIHSFLARPEGSGPFPTIFIAHGGPEAQDYDTFDPAVQAWVDHGYLVVLTNYRGSTGYGKEWQHAIVGRPGFKELEDLAAVHDALVREGLSHPEKTIISGGSWGGYLTLLGLGTQPDRWSLGISVVPMADLVKNYWDENESLRQYDRSLWGGSPDESPDVWRETSPMSYAENLRAPLLIVAGLNDPRSPIDQIHSYTKRLNELGKQYETFFYDAGHGSMRSDERIEQTDVTLDFARRHLGM